MSAMIYVRSGEASLYRALRRWNSWFTENGKPMLDRRDLPLTLPRFKELFSEAFITILGYYIPTGEYCCRVHGSTDGTAAAQEALYNDRRLRFRYCRRIE